MGVVRQAVPDLVQLVDDFGNTSGQAGLSEVHTPPGRLHRGFSVFLIDAWARLLVQRRSPVRLHSAGLWTSSCTGHPLPGESTFRSAWRQLGEEMGIEAFGLTEVGTVRYRLPAPGLTAEDRIIEHEWHHVLVGMTLNTPSPDPVEIIDHRFVPLGDVEAEIDHLGFAACFPVAWRTAYPVLSLMTGPSTAGRQRRPRWAGSET